MSGAQQAWKWHHPGAPQPAGGPAAACPVPAGRATVCCTVMVRLQGHHIELHKLYIGGCKPRRLNAQVIQV